MLSFFLDVLTKLADRIANIDKLTVQNKQTLFNEIAKPLFEEVEPAASNYINFFRSARQAILGNNKSAKKKVILQMDKERNVMQMTRIKIHEMAIQIKNHIKDKDFIEFADAVNDFFYTKTTADSINIALSRSRKFLLELEEYNWEEKEMMAQEIDWVLEMLERSWASIVNSYEKIKIYSTTPKKFINNSKE